VKNSVMEFFGSGVAALSMDYRNGIDVMTTETSCLSSVWQTDGTVQASLAAHGRADAYRELAPQDGAYYDALLEVDLSTIEPMIALPFHPSNTYTIREFNENLEDLLHAVDASAVSTLGLKKQPESLTKKIPQRQILCRSGCHCRLLRRHVPKPCKGGGDSERKAARK